MVKIETCERVVVTRLSPCDGTDTLCLISLWTRYGTVVQFIWEEFVLMIPTVSCTEDIVNNSVSSDSQSRFSS